MDFSSLQSCMELRDAHIVAAVVSSDSMSALMARFGAIAAPGKGAPIILAALARLGTTACDWLDGELRVDLTSESEGGRSKTRIAVSTTIGAGFREKLFPDTIVDAPLAEFARGIQRAPRLVEPLTVRETSKHIVLSVTAAVRRTSLPPPMVQLDPSSFLAPLPVIAPPFASSEPPPGPIRRPAAPPPGPATAPIPGAASPPAPRKIVLRRRTRPDDGDPEG